MQKDKKFIALFTDVLKFYGILLMSYILLALSLWGYFYIELESYKIPVDVDPSLVGIDQTNYTFPDFSEMNVRGYLLFLSGCLFIFLNNSKNIKYHLFFLVCITIIESITLLYNSLHIVLHNILYLYSGVLIACFGYYSWNKYLNKKAYIDKL